MMIIPAFVSHAMGSRLGKYFELSPEVTLMMCGLDEFTQNLTREEVRFCLVEVGLNWPEGMSVLERTAETCQKYANGCYALCGNGDDGLSALKRGVHDICVASLQDDLENILAHWLHRHKAPLWEVERQFRIGNMMVCVTRTLVLGRLGSNRYERSVRIHDGGRDQTVEGSRALVRLIGEAHDYIDRTQLEEPPH